ncbi:MAG: Ppx/GppA phosphatase family protein [Actinomycetes bacterium]
MAPRRTIVEDLGSNSFRLVVYEWEPGLWWRRVDELHETVRIGAGLDSDGVLGRKGIERGLRAVELFAHVRESFGIPIEETLAVATSAIRDAANGGEFVKQAEAVGGAPVRLLSTAEEARYGMLAAVNSTTLSDGWTLDLGGGSMQLCRVEGRRSKRCGSWPLGAVRMTEHYLADGGPASRKAIKDLTKHAVSTLRSDGIEADGGRVVGIGGAVRNLAQAARIEAELPSLGTQGFELTAGALDELIDRLAALPAAKRRDVPGIKPGRGEIILAAAVVLRAALEATGVDSIETTEAGLREGVFFERFLAPADPPLFPDVRGASVRNLALQHRLDVGHAERVADLALGMFDSLRETEAKPGGAKLRELLWAAAMLHDVGKAIDYDDHHRHSKYLILGAGLPGYTQRELALTALMARYHRKGNPDPNGLAGLLEPGDLERLRRCSALLRLAEFLERGRDGAVESAALVPNGKGIKLELSVRGNAALAVWGAERQADAFAAAFGSELIVRP